MSAGLTDNKHCPILQWGGASLKRALILAALCLLLPAAAASAAETSARAMILYAPDTGTVLEEVNADEPLPIASITKIMTALVVLEHCDPAEPVTAERQHTLVEGSAMYLTVGETYTVEELLYGLMLPSGNDAALCLAEHTAGSVEAFADLMNAKCAALGLENSHFVNPHGLTEEGHYSSARDMAILTAEAMKNGLFCEIFGARKATVHGHLFFNHNKLLDYCPDCTGGKTGYTNAAGRTLVSCGERDGLRLICVTLADPNDWNDHLALYNEAFSAWTYLPLTGQYWSEVALASGTAETLAVGCGVPGLLLPKTGEITRTVELPRFVFAPVRAGAVLGRITVSVDGTAVARLPITAQETVLTDVRIPLRPWERLCALIGLYRGRTINNSFERSGL